MSLQLIQDGKGNTTGVYIPINEWKALKKQYKDLQSLEHKLSPKEQILLELMEAVGELKLMEKANLKIRPAKVLLDEL